MKNTITYALASVLTMLTGVVQANMAKTQTSCMPHEQALTYACKVNLSVHNKPVSNAGISVSADMPSMPMAHNMRQIMAVPVAGFAGQYEFVLVLEMAGDWRLVYNISSPFMDRLHEPLVIGKSDKPKQHKTSHNTTTVGHSSIHNAHPN
jgi:hypothetical protein